LLITVMNPPLARRPRLVAVVLRLVRTGFLHTDIACLLVSQLGQLGVELLQLQTRHFFIQMFRQGVDADRIRRVLATTRSARWSDSQTRSSSRRTGAGAATQVDQPTFGQQDDALAVREDHVVDLRLDVFPSVLLQRSDFDFIVEVTDVADDRWSFICAMWAWVITW